MSTTYPNEAVAQTDHAYLRASDELDCALRFANEDHYVAKWRAEARDHDLHADELYDEGDWQSAEWHKDEAAELRELAAARVDERVADERAALASATEALMVAVAQV